MFRVLLTLPVASFGSFGNPLTELESIERKTWACQVSGSFSLTEETSDSPTMSWILSMESNESSEADLNFPNPRDFEAFLQRSSKLASTSYAAGPSILLCRSCHGSLGPSSAVVYYQKKRKNKVSFTLNLKLTLQNQILNGLPKSLGYGSHLYGVSLVSWREDAWEYQNVRCTRLDLQQRLRSFFGSDLHQHLQSQFSDDVCR